MSSEGMILLRCGGCGGGLEGLPGDLLFLCPRCSVCWQIAGTSLTPLALESAEPGPGGCTGHLPFWMLEAETEITKRFSRPRESGFPADTPEFLVEGRPGLIEAPPRRSGEMLFVPAFLTERAIDLGLELTRSAGDLGWASTGPSMMAGGCVSLDDAIELARILVLSREVRQPGSLACAEVSVAPLHSRIAAIPFTAVDGGFSVAGVKSVVPYNSLADARAILGCFGRSVDQPVISDRTVPEGRIEHHTVPRAQGGGSDVRSQ